MTHKLIDNKTGAEIKSGDKVTTFRGETYELRDFAPPKHSASTGRIYLADDDGNISEFYPGVIDAKIIDTRPPKYTVQTITDGKPPWGGENETIGIKPEGEFDSYADAFRKALTLHQREGTYVEIMRGDELIWDSVHGRSNV
jgi:hypothetical protein